MEAKSTSWLTKRNRCVMQKSSCKPIKKHRLLCRSLLLPFQSPINLDPLSSPTAPLNPPGTGDSGAISGAWLPDSCTSARCSRFHPWWKITSNYVRRSVVDSCCLMHLFPCFDPTLRVSKYIQVPFWTPTAKITTLQRCLPLRQPASQNGFEQVDVLKTSDPEILDSFSLRDSLHFICWFVPQ